MFRKFFTALANLTSAVETMTASVQEANNNFRKNLGLDEQVISALEYDTQSNGETKRKIVRTR